MPQLILAEIKTEARKPCGGNIWPIFPLILNQACECLTWLFRPSAGESGK